MLLLISFLSIMLMSPILAGASSAITLQLDRNMAMPGDTVHISGTTEAQKWVSVKAVDSTGNIVFYNAVKSGDAGNYSDQWKIRKDQAEGNLSIVAGCGMNIVSRTLTVGPTTEPTPTPESTPMPTSTPMSTPTPYPTYEPPTDSSTVDQGNEGQQVITEEMLERMVRESQGADAIQIVANAQAREVVVPSKITEVVEGKNLQLSIQDIVIRIDPTNLKHMIAASENNTNKKTNLVVKVNEIPDVAQKAVLSDSPKPGLQVKAARDAVNIQLELQAQEENNKIIQTFVKPVEVALPYNANGLNKELLGVYFYHKESGRLEYVGGDVSETSGKITARVNRSGTYVVAEYNRSFADVPENHWAYTTLKIMAARHIAQGVDGKNYNPSGQITRAEFTALIVKALGLKPSTGATYSDLGETDWYTPYISAASEAGLIKGSPSGEFLPNETITREQMAVILVRAYESITGKQAPSSGEHFKDQDQTSDWADAYIQAAAGMKFMVGKGDNSFFPSDNADRAEAAQALLNMLRNQDVRTGSKR